MRNSLPEVPMTLNTSDNNLALEFYEPCLKWAKRYDRGVGYFTSGWLKENSVGLSYFAANGGKARFITSPILDQRDIEAIAGGIVKSKDIDLVSVLLKDVKLLHECLEKDTLNVISWLVYDGILEFKFAIPTKKLEGGDFHDKFGIFYGVGGVLSFNGSVNDSKKGEANYESIKVFPSWKGLDIFVKDDIKRFERLWGNSDENVEVYDLPDAIRKEIFTLRNSKRPYRLPKSLLNRNKWRHQDEAVKVFLERGNGILEMATGTGKTRTSLKIVNELYSSKKINSVVVTVNGTDLLEQWCKEIGIHTNLTIYKQFSTYKDISAYLLNPEKAALVISRDFLMDYINYFPERVTNNSIIICDEVHGFGSPKMVKFLSGKIKTFKYRLGLSATPEREYDSEGNNFIKREVGEKIFEFKLEDAIRRGILCEFDYYPLKFQLTEEDRNRIKSLIASYSKKKKRGELVNDEDLYREIARVKKVSKAKLPVFYSFLKSHKSILNRSIIFVETKEFGEEVQKILIRLEPNYHTYYGEDSRDNLISFSKGDLNCLITSKRISEGIDIRTVNSIILFSADRAKIQTIQRIGRSLRIDPNNPGKRASIVDFIQFNDDGSSPDEERCDWLIGMSNLKREE